MKHTKILLLILSLVILSACTLEQNAALPLPPMTIQSNSNTTPNSVSDKKTTEAKDETIRVTFPIPDTLVTSPLIVTGEAKGSWFFEAIFPVSLVNEKGDVIAKAQAQAVGDWMTESFVPFRAVITFTKPETDIGMVVLEKSNASGLPSQAASYNIPVRFR